MGLFPPLTGDPGMAVKTPVVLSIVNADTLLESLFAT